MGALASDAREPELVAGADDVDVGEGDGEFVGEGEGEEEEGSIVAIEGSLVECWRSWEMEESRGDVDFALFSVSGARVRDRSLSFELRFVPGDEERGRMEERWGSGDSPRSFFLERDVFGELDVDFSFFFLRATVLRAVEAEGLVDRVYAIIGRKVSLFPLCVSLCHCVLGKVRTLW